MWRNIAENKSLVAKYPESIPPQAFIVLRFMFDVKHHLLIHFNPVLHSM